MQLLTVLIVALGAAACARPLAPVLGRMTGVVLALVPFALFVYFLSQLGAVAGGNALIETLSWAPSLGVDIGFRLDGFSLLFALLITGIGTLVVIYAGAYYAEKPASEGGRFIAFILMFMTAMLGTVLADDLIVMFVFWEATSLISFALIGFDARTYEARRAALQSLLVTGGGGLALFAGILLIGAELGTFSFSEVALRADELVASPLMPAILVLVLVGAFTKSAQVPFQFWLPNAMAAPTPASAYLHSATMVKLGVYLLARFDEIFASVPAFGTTLVIAGSLTMLVAAFEALRATGYKAVLAQSTVASLGILVMLIGLDGEVARVATIGFIIAHAFYKAALFFCAGTVIHATGIAGLRRLGGLARFLPFTAAAAVLASLSMAGLPPFAGFIAKEFLFEAQLESGWSVVPIAIAVIVNAVMVAVAGVVALKPFFVKPERDVKLKHGETAGMLAGPFVLALGGIAMGIAPNTMMRSLVEPAASALGGERVDVSISLWHGLTPMLALSAAVVTIGALVFFNWRTIHVTLRRQRLIHDLFGDRGYQKVLDFVLDMAQASTRFLQNGDQHRYTAVVLASAVFIVAFGVIVGSGMSGFSAVGEMNVPVLIVLAVAVVGGFAAVGSRSLIAAVVAVGIVGFAAAIIFMLNGAPDLALTQFSAEVLLVLILTAVLMRIPTSREQSRTIGERRFDLMLSVAFGIVIFVGVASMTSSPLDMRLSEFFAQSSYVDAFGRNVVNVILVDYRAIDTLGEIAVVGFAAIGVWALLRRLPARKKGS
ncbi:hydrogen gas-evolving membrane-bound hydrogenase subunit E [Aliihoeflea aestuarii]|uniref:hydrogen gas-evolving membrane-bound hydrogenase subunit E n=1 Tax=Aliihoeflea aestuarii TaxID=453840 RepID=UPI002093714E|nr:hydrogen gas-evolving membrane-bound hydrogenase subunit E [Aliihoeflea aestuarii]